MSWIPPSPQICRSIDRVDPDRFTVSALQRMREESIVEVRRLLRSLQYKEATPLVFMGNVSGQSPHFDVREAEEAMWTRKLRMKQGHFYAFFENGWALHDPHSRLYWESLFQSLKSELPQLRKFLRTETGMGGNAHLAIFPVHATSVLILAGRLFGEASSLTIFQYRRERPAAAEGGKWAFDNTPSSDESKFLVQRLRNHSGEDEACLIVSLTYDIATDRLPVDVAEQGDFKMGAVQLSSLEPLHHDILSNEADIDLVSDRLGDAVRTMQDEWGVKLVHLFVCAPASVCFKLGQKMQARNQATFRCYESKSGPKGKFIPTIEIDGREARIVNSSVSLELA